MICASRAFWPFSAENYQVGLRCAHFDRGRRGAVATLAVGNEVFAARRSRARVTRSFLVVSRGIIDLCNARVDHTSSRRFGDVEATFGFVERGLVAGGAPTWLLR